MSAELRFLPDGSITSPKGFLAGATYVGIKTLGQDLRDLGILYSETLCAAAGVFTQNSLKGEPLLLTMRHIARGTAQALVANSGCSNTYTGVRGARDALTMAEYVAQKLGLTPEEVLVGSTGVIGVPLPMERVAQGIEEVHPSIDGGHDFARAIMTTDTRPKETGLALDLGDTTITFGGVAKGAGMLHPNMATMFCFITTDAAVAPEFLKKAVKQAADVSFNAITVDGDTSPDDMLVVLANGQAKTPPIEAGTPEAIAFQKGLNAIAIRLAKEIVADAEGATKVIEVTVSNALTPEDAHLIARSVAGSLMVKTAVHGSDPNWGRILQAAGKSGAVMRLERLDLSVGDICFFRDNTPQPFDPKIASVALQGPEVHIRLNLNIGPAQATAWGCDISTEYVTFNSDYTT